MHDLVYSYISPGPEIPIFLDELQCTTSDPHLRACSRGEINCIHNRDLILSCQAGNIGGCSVWKIVSIIIIMWLQFQREVCD